MVDFEAIDKSLLFSECEEALRIAVGLQQAGYDIDRRTGILYKAGYLAGMEKQRRRDEHERKRRREYWQSQHGQKSPPEATKEGSTNNE